MRRTDEEFKVEVFRRSDSYRSRRNRVRRILLTCLPILLCCGLWIRWSLNAQKSTDTASAMGIEYSMAVCEDEKAGAEYGCILDVPPEILGIEVIPAPEEAGERKSFTESEQLGRICAAIQDIIDDPDTVVGHDEIGECEGTAYSIIIRGETEMWEYTLLQDALLTESGWLVNASRCQALQALICD